MKRTFVLPIALLLIVSAAVLAGCSSTLSKSEYIKEMKAIGKKVDKQFETFSSGQPTEGDINKAVAGIRTAADEMEGLNPPDNIKDEHEELITILNDTADLFEELAPSMEKFAMAAKDPSSLSKADQAQLQKDMTKLQGDMEGLTKRMNSIKKKYEKAGYGDIEVGE